MGLYGWHDNDLKVDDLEVDSTITFGDAFKFTGRFYANPTGYTKTILKIHNHDTTAEIGSLETKGEFKNQSGLCLGQANYWSYEPTNDTGAPSQLSASENVVAVDTGMTVTSGNIYGLTGQVQLYGTLNGSAVNVAGVIGVISATGANTKVLHMAGVQSAIAGGVVNPSTGTLSHFLANTAGTIGVTLIDNLLCMVNSQIITNFASFSLAATDKCVETNTGTPSGAVAHIIRVLIAGTPGYIPVYAAKPS